MKFKFIWCAALLLTCFTLPLASLAHEEAASISIVKVTTLITITSCKPGIPKCSLKNTPSFSPRPPLSSLFPSTITYSPASVFPSKSSVTSITSSERPSCLRWSLLAASKSTDSPVTTTVSSCVDQKCNADNCLRGLEQLSAQGFCSTFTKTTWSALSDLPPKFTSKCTGDVISRVSSVCTCLNSPCATMVVN